MFDVARQSGGAPDRPDKRTQRSLANVERTGDITQREIAAIYRVSQYAQMLSLMATLTQRRAEFLAPEAAEAQSMIAFAADMAAVSIISELPQKMG